MTSQLLLHKNTRAQAKAIIAKPPQTILITGMPGSGKDALAEYLAGMLLNVEPEKLSNHPYYLIIERQADKSEISIDVVRQVIKSLSLKSLSANDNKTNRVVNIKDAHLLSREAQNALLKIIEEPPAKTVFLLSATSVQAILPTIASRSQRLAVLPVSWEQTAEYFSQSYSDQAIKSAWSLSQGAAGIMSAILKDDIDHPLKKAVDLSKDFLKTDTYERLVLLDKLTSDKDALQAMLDGLARVLKELHRSAAAAQKNTQAERLLTSRRLVNSARESLNKKTAARLIVLNLALHLPI